MKTFFKSIWVVLVVIMSLFWLGFTCRLIVGIILAGWNLIQ